MGTLRMDRTSDVTDPPPPSSKGPDDQNVPQHGHYLPHGVPFSENTFQSQPPLFVGLSTRPNLAFLSGTISRSFRMALRT